MRPALAGGAGLGIVPAHGPAFVVKFALAGKVLLDDHAKDFKPRGLTCCVSGCTLALGSG